MVASVYIDGNGILGVQIADGSRHDSTITMTANTWHEIELQFTVNGTARADRKD